MDKPQAKGIKKYYHWVVFGACFFMIFMVLGFGSTTKSTYLTAITDDLGLERGLYSINDSCRYITTAILAFFFGKIVEKIGARKMVIMGFACLIISFLTYSFAHAYWQFWIGGAFLGAGIAWTNTTIVGYIVEKWFSNNKGTVMGIILAANGLGGVASEQIITRIIYGWHGEIADPHATHWRLAYQVTAILFAVVGVIVVSLLRNKPSDMGLVPLGQDAPKKKKRGLSWEGYDLKTIYRKPYFYVSGFCVFIMGFILQAMTNVSKPHMYDVGLNKEYVLYVFSIHALCLAVSKIIAGFSYDHIGIRKTFAWCCSAAVFATTCLSFVTASSTVLPWVYSIISSFGMPLETVMVPLLVSDMFGRKSYSRVMGYYISVNTFGYACGVPLANLFYDIMGTYKPALIILSITMAVAAIVAQFSMKAAIRDREAFLAARKKEQLAAEEENRG